MPKTSKVQLPLKFLASTKNISNNFISPSFPPLFHPDGTTAITSGSKVELFPQTFTNNPTLDDSGLVPLSPAPISCLWLKFLAMMFSML